jgi:hypothetical protein
MDKTPTDVPSNVIVAPDKTLNSITPVFSKSMNGILVTGVGTINMFLAMSIFFSYFINTSKVVIYLKLVFVLFLKFTIIQPTINNYLFY